MEYNNYNIDDNTNNIDKICIICWNLSADNKLCIKCIYLYCDECAYKINYKCCICERRSRKIYYDYNNEFELDTGYSPMYYFYSSFYWLLFIIISILGIGMFGILFLKFIFIIC